MADQAVKEQVRAHYGKLAQIAQESAGLAAPCCGASEPCCGSNDPKAVSSGLYAADQVATLPADVADSSWGSGNPVAFAELRPGEVVVDLGSGGGLDCLLAAQQVGETGKAIGVDMTPQMLGLAEQNAAAAGMTNVEFRRGELEALPLEDASADVIISNCVINLSPDKDAVLAEAFRVLKPGGRFVVSDVVLERALPEAVANSPAAWCGCVAGALKEDDFLARARAAGFVDVEEVAEGTSSRIAGYAKSALIRARKP